MHLYAPSNHVQNLRNEVIHTYIQTSILSGCKKEIYICIKIQSLMIMHLSALSLSLSQSHIYIYIYIEVKLFP
jgi:hypothetical protein